MVTVLMTSIMVMVHYRWIIPVQSQMAVLVKLVETGRAIDFLSAALSFADVENVAL